jgi:5-(carboxyamino)imidazole ribonucleotide synthase
MLGLPVMKIGVLGAGQLGQMLALAGYPLGLEFKFFDTQDAPAGQMAELVVGDYINQDALKDFAQGLDVITYFFKSLGILTPDFVDVQSRDDLERLGFPCILKTRRMGYDGKGQAVLRSSDDAEVAWVDMSGQSLIVESFVPFEREVSVIAARALSGEIKIYPLTENVHREGILRKSLAPARVSSELQAQAEIFVTNVLQKLNYVGVLAIEFFVLNNQLVANEMAPRVHNSGHWTIEGAETSQFENHLRAVAGFPLGEVTPRGYSAMLNLIGVKPEFEKLLELPHTHLHWYGKSVKPNRKVGHVTLRADSKEQLAQLLENLSG